MGFFRNTVLTGTLASAGTTAGAALFAKLEGETPAAPINAISHVAWGPEAQTQDQLDVRHTAVGFGLNTLATASWGALQELFLRRKKEKVTLGEAVVSGVAVSALAYVTDYHVVPERFKPGFEKRLSKNALFGVYAILAVTLAAGALLREED